jgi:divalent metal cation (Fe/Co/Zn/Cd) transporter
VDSTPLMPPRKTKTKLDRTDFGGLRDPPGIGALRCGHETLPRDVLSSVSAVEGLSAMEPTGHAASRAVRLEYATIGWNSVEAGAAVASGIAAGSVALVAFGLDSAIEIVSATVVLLHLRALLAGAEPDQDRERRALRIIAVTFFLLAAYVLVDAAVTLIRAEHPRVSPTGLAITAAAVIVMPLLAWGKRRTAGALLGSGQRGSAALLTADSAETALCGVLSLATLIGVGANAVLGWWWADPLAGLVVVYYAIREGKEAWEGELLEDADEDADPDPD